jgi:hypothetical protein
LTTRLFIDTLKLCYERSKTLDLLKQETAHSFVICFEYYNKKQIILTIMFLQRIISIILSFSSQTINILWMNPLKYHKMDLNYLWESNNSARQKKLHRTNSLLSNIHIRHNVLDKFKYEKRNNLYIYTQSKKRNDDNDADINTSNACICPHSRHQRFCGHSWWRMSFLMKIHLFNSRNTQWVLYICKASRFYYFLLYKSLYVK